MIYQGSLILALHFFFNLKHMFRPSASMAGDLVTDDKMKRQRFLQMLANLLV